MRRTHLFLPLVGGLLILFLGACDDPSNVGIGLVEEGAEPVVRTFGPSQFEAAPLEDVTGAALRVLAGRVADPLLGTVTAVGYADFQSVFDTTGGPTITGAALRLVRDYVYGDTTATVSLTLHDLVEDWNALGTPADTTLPLGAAVTTFSFAALDSLVEVALPEAWVAANDTTLRSAVFASVFHGFAMTAETDAAVVGFDARRSTLRIFTDVDTLDYPLARTLSGLARTGEPALPENRIAVQDGVGPGLAFNFDFETAGLEETPLNGAIIRLFADSASVQTTPPHFVRPLLRTLQLVRITDDESVFLVAEATLDDRGHYRFSQPAIAGAPTLREVLQQTFFGERLYDHFELRMPVNNNTINVVLLFDAAEKATAPEAVLTVSPSN